MLSSQKPFRGTQLNRTHPLAKGLVGCWLFNEATGEAVFDSSGNGNNGTLENGVAWGDGGSEFDGVNDYVDCGNDASLQTFTEITLEGWAKANSFAEIGAIVGKATPYYLAIISSDIIKFRHFGLGDGHTNVAFSSTTNTWYHIVATWDGSNTSIYVNGVYKGGESATGTISSLTGNLAIGDFQAGSNFYNFNGSIDSVRIYNRALSVNEIVWLYREPYAMFEPTFNPTIYGAAFTKREILNITSTIDQTLATTSTIDQTLATTSTIDQTLALSSKMDIEAAA